MKTKTLFVFGTLALVGCGGFEGTYTLDKAETTAPQPRNAGDWQVTLQLKPGGASSKTTTRGHGTDAKTHEEGTWAKDGDEITILLPSEEGPMTCTKRGKKLTCVKGVLGPKETTYFISVFIKS